MRTLHITLLVVGSWTLMSSAQPRPPRTFDAYVVDVEGGEATLFARKGGAAQTFRILSASPGLADLWQNHYSVLAGAEHNPPESFIANLEEGSPLPGAQGQAPVHMGPAHWIKLAAGADGSFSITNSRTGLTKRYEGRK